MDRRERGQLVLFLYRPVPGECYFLDIILGAGADLSDAPMIERAKREVLERGKSEELVMARWGTEAGRPFSVYLAKTDTVYHGDEATRIYRRSYGVSLRCHEAPDLSVASSRTVASTTRTRIGKKSRPPKKLSLSDIADGLEGYVAALRALVDE
jgi:hypothetical protein